MAEKTAFDTLEQFRDFYSPHAEEKFFDADGPWQVGVNHVRGSGGDLGRVRRELAAVLAEDLTDAELHLRTVSLVMVPAGRDARTFLEYLLRRLDEAISDPRPADLDGGGSGDEGLVWGEGVLHRSRFSDRAAAELATRDVLRANENHFRAWAADPQGTPRLHLVADLGRVVGTCRGVDGNGRIAGEPTPVTACAVLMRLDADTGRPVVVTSYPEPSVSETTRRRYPDLTGLFGGFFGQDLRVVDHDFWSAERHFHVTTAPTVVARAVDQLGRLLTDQPTEQALRAAVHDLGSCLNPADMRRWVSGLLLRATDLEWI
ncbi:MAG: contact-dependent growth inhibition system immunity protein [Kineosporiaceae bacterium]